MAYTFARASEQYLEVTSAPTTDEPITLVCLAYPVAEISNTIYTLMSIQDRDQNDNYHRLATRVSSGGANEVYAQTRSDAGTNQSAYTAVEWAVNTWGHFAAVYSADDNRIAYLNGVAAIAETTSHTVATLDSVSIARVGDSSPDEHFDGLIAEVAVYDADLTAAEIAILAAGYSPKFVRPQSIVAYWSLIRNLVDQVGGFDLTAFNTPTVSVHPPIIYPAPPFLSFPALEEVAGLPSYRAQARGILRGVGRGVG